MNWQSIIHFRLLAIALGAYEATGKQRYLDLLTDYSDMWAKVILAAASDEDLPRVFTDLSAGGAGPLRRAGSRAASTRAATGCTNTATSWPRALPCAPGAMAGDLVSTMLEVYRHAAKPAYKDALHRVLRHWLGPASGFRRGQPSAQEPYGGYYYLKYRDFTGDSSLDSLCLERFPVGVPGRDDHGRDRPHAGAASASAATFWHLLMSNSGRWGPGRVVTHGCNALLQHWRGLRHVMPVLHLPVFGGMTVHFGRPPWMNVAYYTDGKLGLPRDVAAFCSPARPAGAAT